MPRKAKSTMGGDRGSPARAPAGVPYGEGERALESQRRMPVPDTKGQNPVPSGGGGGGTSGAPADADPFAAAMQMAQQMAPPTGMLAGETTRPNEPLMTGMGTTPTGPTFDDGLMELRALARQYPYPELLQLLSAAELEL